MLGPPQLFAQLSKVSIGKGSKILTSEVYSFSDRKGKLRSEIVVAADYESLEIYNVRFCTMS